jgi:hypothetical protein
MLQQLQVQIQDCHGNVSTSKGIPKNRRIFAPEKNNKLTNVYYGTKVFLHNGVFAYQI